METRRPRDCELTIDKIEQFELNEDDYIAVHQIKGLIEELQVSVSIKFYRRSIMNKNNNLTILVVDDNKYNVELLQEILTEYDVVVARNGSTAIEMAKKETIDLILLDIRMPDINGYEVCEKLKQDDETKDIPIIFVTVETNELSIEKAFDLGGADYVTKPFKTKELLARVKTQLKLQSLIEHLNFLAFYDPMTEIYNRRKFFELATKLFATSDNLFAVMLDIDEFKAINDQYGHAVGDQVIKAVTKTISAILAEEAVFGRLGGEEFAIICLKDSVEKLQHEVEKICSAVAQLEVIVGDNQRVKCTISSGIAQKKPQTTNLAALLKAADDALYNAKGSGRKGAVFRI